MGTEEHKEALAGDKHDNLATIGGIGSTAADALYRIGIRRFADLAHYTPERLAKVLREQAGVKISPKRIAAENWIGQAKTLISAAHTPSMEEGTMAKKPDEGSGVPNWHQHAGFSLFFDAVAADADNPTWQTRLYHDETGDEALLPGIDTAAWVKWILDRAELPDTARTIASALQTPPPPSAEALPSEPATAALPALATPYAAQVEILDVQVFEALTTPPAGAEKRLVAETRFQISGTEAEAMTNDRIPFRVEVHAINLNSGRSNLLSSQQGQLEPQVFEYTLQSDFPVPDFGRYEIHTLVLLLPPGDMMTYCQGPNLSIV
jgi:hypothetical protein